jgi:hypothetical protein
MFTLDPYAARSCPVKTNNAFHPGVARPEQGSGHARLPGSAEFLAATYERILAGDASVVDLRTLAGEPSEEQ